MTTSIALSSFTSSVHHFVSAPDLDSRLSFIDLCCIFAEETGDKLQHLLLTSQQSDVASPSSHHSIPAAQLSHLQSALQSVIEQVQHLQEQVAAHKSDDSDDEDDGSGHAAPRNQPELSQAWQQEDEDDASDSEHGKENAAADANIPLCSSPPRNCAKLASFTPPETPASCLPESSSLSPPRSSAPTPSPASAASVAAPPSPLSTLYGTHTPSLRRSPYASGSRDESLSTPATPTLDGLGLSDATLSFLLRHQHGAAGKKGRESESSLDSLGEEDEEAAARPGRQRDLPSTLLVLRRRKAREEQQRQTAADGGRLSTGSDASASSAQSPPIPNFSSVLARTPHTNARNVALTAATSAAAAGQPCSPSSPALRPSLLSFDDAASTVSCQPPAVLPPITQAEYSSLPAYLLVLLTTYTQFSAAGSAGVCHRRRGVAAAAAARCSSRHPSQQSGAAAVAPGQTVE